MDRAPIITRSVKKMTKSGIVQLPDYDKLKQRNDSQYVVTA